MYETYIFIFNLMVPSFGQRSHVGNLTFIELKHDIINSKMQSLKEKRLSSKAVYSVFFLHLAETLACKFKKLL